MQDLDFADFEQGGGEASSPATEPAITVALADTGAGSRRYTLLAPLLVNGERLDEVTLRQPTQGDLDDFANGEIGSRRLLLARLVDLDLQVIRGLTWADSQAIHQMLADLVPHDLLGAE